MPPSRLIQQRSAIHAWTLPTQASRIRNNPFVPRPTMPELALDRIEVTTVGDFLDLWSTGRALARTFTVLGWIALAVAYGSPWSWLWGVPLLMSSAASWRHAWGDGQSWWDRLNARTVGRVPKPHFLDGVRVVELLGVGAAAAATGGWIGVFERPDAAMVATGLVLVSALLGLANVVAHRSHVRFPGATAYQRQRRLVAVGGGVALCVLLWPDDVAGPAVAGVVMGSAFVAASAWRSAYHLDHTVRLTEEAIREAFGEAISDLYGQLHGTLRNPARGALVAIGDETFAASRLRNRLAERGEVEHPSVSEWVRASQIARQRTIAMVTRVSEYVEATGAGRLILRRRASDVVAAIVAFHVTDDSLHRDAVVRELDPETLDEGDLEAIDLCLNELVTNALTARARHLEVTIDASIDDAGIMWVYLRVLCSCGSVIGSGRPRGGRLGLLAEQLEDINGTLNVYDDGQGTHVSEATWPTDANPGVLDNSVRSAARADDYQEAGT